MILVPVFDDDGPSTTWTRHTPGMAARLGPLEADAAGGDQRRFRGFEREPWFNLIDGVAIAPPTPPNPSEAARA